ncbi:hypothetical protein AB675_10912, partial [Cyphellophora attinorum]
MSDQGYYDNNQGYYQPEDQQNGQAMYGDEGYYDPNISGGDYYNQPPPPPNMMGQTWRTSLISAVTALL